MRAEMAKVNLAEIKFGSAVGDRQTAKLNYPPNFPAIYGIPKIPYGISAEGTHAHTFTVTATPRVTSHVH